jgi:hypothetical protein
MKRHLINILMIILTICMFAGCTGKQIADMNTQAGPDICLTKPPEVKSYLCDAAAKSGLTLNAIDGILLDASAIGVIAAKLNKDQIGKFLNKMDSYLDVKDMTYALLIDKMKLDAASATAIQAIISRRIGMFSIPDIISDYDIGLIRLEIKRQKEQFGIA